MSQSPTTEYTDVEAQDPEDAHLTELAVSLAIAETLAHPPDPGAMSADRAEAIIESAVGQTLRFYAQRTIHLFLTSWRSGSTITEFQADAANEVLNRVISTAIDETGESVRDIVRTAARRAAPSGPVVYESGLQRDAEAYRRLRVGLEGVSRLLVTRTRETAKYEYATQVGALGKTWRTRRDGKVRTTHGDLEGDFVLLNEYFVTVRGNRIRRPGDVRSPLSETINCRCSLSYRMPVS